MPASQVIRDDAEAEAGDDARARARGAGEAMTMAQTALALEHRIIGDSAPIRALRARIARYAPSDLPVLIQGPSGCGKELVAEAVHALSGRPGNFVSFNVCAIAETMFEDAVFGHARGAFTGADRDRKGYLAEAHRGTVLLDEIGGLSSGMQLKLLRAIETRRFRPVGAASDGESDFRVVAASNENVLGLVADGRFRLDLAHRLNALTLEVPALAARVEDVARLAWHFASRHSTNGTAGVRLTGCAIDALQAYPWPGNVRELQHIIVRAVLEADGQPVNRRHITQALSQGSAPAVPVNLAEIAERRALVALLEGCDWDTTVAAARLGVNRVTVYRRMRRLGVTVPIEIRRAPRPADAIRHIEDARSVVDLQRVAAN